MGKEEKILKIAYQNYEKTLAEAKAGDHAALACLFWARQKVERAQQALKSALWDRANER